jgi:hypothetical protein
MLHCTKDLLTDAFCVCVLVCKYDYYPFLQSLRGQMHCMYRCVLWQYLSTPVSPGHQLPVHIRFLFPLTLSHFHHPFPGGNIL